MSAEYTTTVDGMRVQVDKVGGGTVGRAYEGRWSVTVHNGPVLAYDSEELTTGAPKTHAQVAFIAAEFAGADIDPVEHYPLWESKSWLEQHSILAAHQWRGYDD